MHTFYIFAYSHSLLSHLTVEHSGNILIPVNNSILHLFQNSGSHHWLLFQHHMLSALPSKVYWVVSYHFFCFSCSHFRSHIGNNVLTSFSASVCWDWEDWPLCYSEAQIFISITIPTGLLPMGCSIFRVLWQPSDLPEPRFLLLPWLWRAALT